MESLNETEWDVLIDGTGLHQSLLALALSRSGKKVLHVDGNGYYGGSEAALSLQEAEEWVYGLGSPAEFSDACISQPQLADTDGPKLSVSRAYSLALAPHLIYNQSKLLHYLVVSKVYRQLEFQAMGSWWVYTTSDGLGDSGTEDSKQKAPGRLLKVPTNREDVAFSDSDLDLRSKRAVMKVLRFISDYENQLEIWEPYRSKPFVDFLTEHFKLPDSLKGLFLALTLSRNPPSQTSTGFALPRISRHLRSIGRLGPGFSSVIPKWGGLSEVVQVACRAGAVGGGIYVLGNGIAKVEHGSTSTKDDADTADTNNSVKVRLTGGDIVRTKVIVGLSDSLPVSDPAPAAEITASSSPSSASCSITIVSSTLESLYPVLAEGTPPPAGAIVVFPSGSLTTNKTSAEDTPPVYLTIHSAATGECPSGQSVIYSSTSQPPPHGADLLKTAVDELLCTLDEPSSTRVMWSMYYVQRGPSIQDQEAKTEPPTSPSNDTTLIFPRPSLDLAFDDDVFGRVAKVWRQIIGADAEGVEFLVFADREGEADEDEDED